MGVRERNNVVVSGAVRGQPILFAHGFGCDQNMWRYEQHRSYARVVVSDRGPGVPRAERERVFEKFVRLDPEQISGVNGTGLGLYVARELARRMHGTVGVLDNGPGAAVHLDVPLAR